MFQLTLTFSTHDELQAAVNAIGGVDVATLAGGTITTPPKTPTNKVKGKAATEAAFTEKAPVTAGKKTKVPTVEELKQHILEHAGDAPDANEKVKAYVRTFGVAKLSDMDDATRAKALKGAEAHFASLEADDEGGEEEEDPMA